MTYGPVEIRRRFGKKSVNLCRTTRHCFLDDASTIHRHRWESLKSDKCISCEENYAIIRNEALIAVVMKSSIFYDIIPYTPLKVSRRFGEKCSLYLQGWKLYQGRNQHEAGSNGSHSTFRLKQAHLLLWIGLRNVYRKMNIKLTKYECKKIWIRIMEETGKVAAGPVLCELTHEAFAACRL
jgi:hypothetical protein